MCLKKIYEKYINIVKKYDKLFLIATSFLLALATIYIIIKVPQGLLNLDVSLRGGYILNFDKNLDINTIKSVLSNYTNIYSFKEEGNYYVFETSEFNLTNFINYLSNNYNISLNATNFNYQFFSSYIGRVIYNEFFRALFLATLLIFIVIFLRYRKFAISFTIILNILFDILLTIFVLSIINYPVGALVFVALLMTLGFGIDNNIVLASNIEKEKERSLEERIQSSLKIGILMNMSVIIILIPILLLVNLKEIGDFSLTIILALTFDTIYYLFGNVPYYLYVYKKEKQNK